MTLVLHRFNVKPGHLDAYLALWPAEVALRQGYGFASHQAYLETHAEPKVTWLYSTPPGRELSDLELGHAEAGLRNDPQWQQLEQAKTPHVFRNLLVRPVEQHYLLKPAPMPNADRTVVMRRYSIVGDWTQFLDIWRKIVPVREKYGFRCLFAVADEPANMFTWAFDYQGNWQEFPQRQRDYYHDPARVELRGVFDFMADYAITPAAVLPTELTTPAR